MSLQVNYCKCSLIFLSNLAVRGKLRVRIKFLVGFREFVLGFANFFLDCKIALGFAKLLLGLRNCCWFCQIVVGFVNFFEGFTVQL